jgi:hypothetical protein
MKNSLEVFQTLKIELPIARYGRLEDISQRAQSFCRIKSIMFSVPYKEEIQLFKPSWMNL